MKKIIIPVVLVLTALAGYFIFKPKSNDVARIKTGPIVEAVYGLGKVKAVRKYEVKVAIITHVEKLFVKEGQTVKKGDPLVKFRDSAIFNAPFDGTITSTPFHEQEIVGPQIMALQMMDLSERYIEVSLEQEAALKVLKNQKAHIIFESLKGVVIDGTVSAIFPREEEFLAHIQTKNMGENILPGMSADVAIEVHRKDKVNLIPTNAIHNGKVTILRKGKKSKIDVSIGAVEGPWAELLSTNIEPTDDLILGRKK